MSLGRTRLVLAVIVLLGLPCVRGATQEAPAVPTLDQLLAQAVQDSP